MAEAATAANRGRPPFLAIALLSATALGYEILLMRLFSIIQWHHFAYMVISLALLGYGVSGTFLVLAQRWIMRRFELVYLANLALFAVATVVCYLVAQQIPFNPEEVLWDMHQPLWLLALYLLLMLPFFFAANGVAMGLMRYRDRVSRIYAADLLGAGVGSLAVVVLLFAVFPATALVLLGGAGLLAAAVAGAELRVRPVAWVVMLVVAAFITTAILAWGPALVLSPYKDLSQILRIPGARVIDERSSPLGFISVVESTKVPLRHAPGLSMTAEGEPPAQLGVFTDGGGMTVITQDRGNPAAFAYLDKLTTAAPYHLSRPQRVLVLGAGGGSDVLQARYHGVAQVDAVELNPKLIELVRRDHAGFAGGLYSQPGIDVHIAEARGFVAGSGARYDLIQVALLDSFSASTAGLYALSESYLYTVEALQTYVGHLAPGGYLSISRWIRLPPRDALKLFATAVEALRRDGIAEPAERLLLIRGWQTSTLLIKNGAVSAEEIAALRVFCRERAFDLAYYPGMTQAEANRYNVLSEPYFYRGATAILGDEPSRFFDQYKFDVAPTTDDRPYFFHFFKWRVLPEILQLRGQGGMALLEWGYLVLVATLAQAVVVSIVLILLPLAFYRRAQAVPDRVSPVRVVVYFFAIGLAFLFIEMACMQKFILFLHHPLYAAAVVLSAFLVFAGFGSAWSKREADLHRYRQGARLAIAGVVGLGLIYALTLGPLFNALIAVPVAVKILVAVGLIAPLAFCMGMPFPLAMASLGAHAPTLMPWAWGVNGCASVLSAVLATLLAIHFGFTSVIVLAVVLYLFAGAVFPSARSASA